MGQGIRLRAKPASSEPSPPLADDLASARRNPKRFSRLRANANYRLVVRQPFGSRLLPKVRFGLQGLCEKPDGATSRLRPTATRRQNATRREMSRNDGTEAGNESPATTGNENRESATQPAATIAKTQKRDIGHGNNRKYARWLRNARKVSLSGLCRGLVGARPVAVGRCLSDNEAGRQRCAIGAAAMAHGAASRHSR